MLKAIQHMIDVCNEADFEADRLEVYQMMLQDGIILDDHDNSEYEELKANVPLRF
tara:strand:- start:245 stop:409 length:165 start_codon:yes stop_codon:yes gene_type:complete